MNSELKLRARHLIDNTEQFGRHYAPPRLTLFVGLMKRSNPLPLHPHYYASNRYLDLVYVIAWPSVSIQLE